MSRRNRKNPEERISLKNEFNAWQQKKEERTLGILNGLIYEYYCYDKIIHDNPHIHIITNSTILNKIGIIITVKVKLSFKNYILYIIFLLNFSYFEII